MGPAWQMSTNIALGKSNRAHIDIAASVANLCVDQALACEVLAEHVLSTEVSTSDVAPRKRRSSPLCPRSC